MDAKTEKAEYRRRVRRQTQIAELIASGEATTFGEAIARLEGKIEDDAN